jgi:hypothetical protein
MKPVLRTTNRSLVESLRIALDAEGIAAVYSNDTGSGLPFVPVTVAVDDTEYERALSLVHDLEPSSSSPNNPAASFSEAPSRVLWVLLAVAILLFCGL